MASYFRATLRDFLDTSDTEVLAKLTLAYANSGFSRMHTDQPLTWWDDLVELRQALHALTTANPSSNYWQILLEFSIPRKERRLDIVLLTGAEIILLECKRGPATTEALRQVEEYALLLHYFHKPSHQQHIYPIVVSADASLFLDLSHNRHLMAFSRKPTRVHRRRGRTSTRWRHVGRGCLLTHTHHHRRGSCSPSGTQHSRNRPLR